MSTTTFATESLEQTATVSGENLQLGQLVAVTSTPMKHSVMVDVAEYEWGPVGADPKECNDSANYRVEALVDVNLDLKKDGLIYLVKWESFDSSCNSWQTEKSLIGTNDALMDAINRKKFEELQPQLGKGKTTKRLSRKFKRAMEFERQSRLASKRWMGNGDRQDLP